MIRTSRMPHIVLPLLIVLAAMPASSDVSPTIPVIDSTSSGLFTFSREERAIRVVAVFAAQESTVVPTLVRFVDQGGIVLKEVRGDLRQNIAVVADLTRDDVAGRGDLLVRVQVLHMLPGLRRESYPIVVTTQPISQGGSGRWVLNWNGGLCGFYMPGSLAGQQSASTSLAVTAGQPVEPSKPIPPGTSVMCWQATDFTF